MISRRKLNILVGVSVVVGLAVVSTATGLTGALLSNDNFNEGSKTEITLHVPDSDATSGGWTVELGDWEVHHGRVKEKSDANAPVSSDYRALLDAGVPDVSTEVSLKIEGGDQYWGTVVRHAGDHDWIMAFHDGIGDIVLGKKRPDEDLHGDTVPTNDPSAGGFQELGRVAVNWNNGQTHTIGLKVTGSAITVYADAVDVITATDDDNMNSHFVGIFSRGDGANKLESFTVNQE